MKTTTKKEENVMNVANPTAMKENPVLSTEELFNVEGGEDVDLDADCYTQQCVIGANICNNVSTACVIAN